MTDKGYWLRRLNEVAGSRGEIRWPSKLGIEGRGDSLRLTAAASATIDNMQKDASAFEGWCLALRHLFGVGEITLDWKPPVPRPVFATRARGHYERFLYRVKRFEQLFPDWFSVAEPQLLAESLVIGRTEKLMTNAHGTRGTAVRPRPEALLERALLDGLELRSKFNLSVADRQFPVGLFEGEVSKLTPVFPRGASAIDLVGIADGTFVLFELKAEDNCKVGIISELLFYTSFIRDLLAIKDAFKVDTKPVPKGVTVSAREARACQRIKAVFLVPSFHPLVHPKGMVSILNAAATANWGRSPDHLPVEFDAYFVKPDGPAQRQLTHCWK